MARRASSNFSFWPAMICVWVCRGATGVLRRSSVVTRVLGRRGVCGGRGAVTSISGSTVVPFAAAANGTTVLPEIDVTAPRPPQTPRRPKTRVTTDERRNTPVAPRQTQTQIIAGQNEKFDEARRAIVAPTGAGSY